MKSEAPAAPLLPRGGLSKPPDHWDHSGGTVCPSGSPTGDREGWSSARLRREQPGTNGTGSDAGSCHRASQPSGSGLLPRRARRGGQARPKAPPAAPRGRSAAEQGRGGHTEGVRQVPTSQPRLSAPLPARREPRCHQPRHPSRFLWHGHALSQGSAGTVTVAPARSPSPLPLQQLLSCAFTAGSKDSFKI